MRNQGCLKRTKIVVIRASSVTASYCGFAAIWGLQPYGGAYSSEAIHIIA